MSDYIQTPSSVLASAQAKRLIPNPSFEVKNGAVVPLSFIAGAELTAGMPVHQASDNYIYPADATLIASQTSGSLVVGRRYIITTFFAGDNFTNVGASANVTGTIFTATGTTPTTWSNGSTLNDAEATYKAIGFSENAASAGQPVSIIEEDPSFTPGCTLAVGDIVIVSGDPGKICQSSDMAAGDYVTVMGVAWSATKMAVKVVRADAIRV